MHTVTAHAGPWLEALVFAPAFAGVAWSIYRARRDRRGRGGHPQIGGS